MGLLVRNNKVITASGKILYRKVSNPLDLPNLKLYLSATRMPQYADGTAISSFLDYSGNNYNATQASGTLQPTFQTNEFGVYAGIKFDSVNDLMTLSGGALDIFKNINQFTVQAVFKRTALGASQLIYQALINVGSSTRFAISCNSTSIAMTIRILDAGASYSILIPSNDLAPHMIQSTFINGFVYTYLDGVFHGATNVGGLTFSNTSSVGSNVGGSVTSAIWGANINGVSVNTSYSDNATIQAQYRGYLQRGYL